jgi:hypothetical protein
MDSQHTVTQVYILGDKSNVQTCVERQTRRPCVLQNMWTVISVASLLEGMNCIYKKDFQL